MLREAHAEGVKKAYCHILLDGRDVPATSALEYVDMLEKVLAELNTEGCDYAIASGGGRMQITMDRYEANWPMVEQGWRTHVQAIGRRFPSAKAAIETYRAETGCIDQDLPAFVIERSGEPVAKIANGDSVHPLQLPGRPGAGDLSGLWTARTLTTSTGATTPA